MVVTPTSLRVGIVAENYFPTLGGIQEHIRHLKNYLVSLGAMVVIVTGAPEVPANAPCPADTEDRVSRVGRSTKYGIGGTYTQATFSPASALRLRRLLHQHRLDLLNIHGPCDPGLPAMATALFRGPKVFTLHSCFPDTLWRRLVAPYYGWVFSQARAVVAVSEATRDSMRRYADFEAEVIPNGVEARYWEQGHPLPHLVGSGRKNLLYLGRLEPRNGIDLLLDAFPAIAAADENIRLIVAGDGPLRARCENRLPPMLRDRVQFLGAVYDQRPDLFASSHLMIIPARAVGFSIMVLESFAAGLPVVALPALGVDRAGAHWSNVVLADEVTAPSLARAILTAMSEDRSARIRRGREIAREHDWSRVGPRILDVFQRALG